MRERPARKLTRTAQHRMVYRPPRLEQHYTLPLGNIRVQDFGVREAFSMIEDEFRNQHGAVPNRSQILLAALVAYHKALARPGGGTGRHTGLKSRRPAGRAGSSPARGKPKPRS